MVHCTSAWRAIHVCFLTNARRGTLAGFCAGQSSGCVDSERLRHKRLQKRATHAPLDVAGHLWISEDERRSVSSVVQYAHARDVICRS